LVILDQRIKKKYGSRTDMHGTKKQNKCKTRREEREGEERGAECVRIR